MKVTDIFATMSDDELNLYTEISTNYKQTKKNNIKLNSKYLILSNDNQEQQIKIPNNLHIINAENKTFGSILAEAVTFLKGKYKPYYIPNSDCGDFVIIINAQEANVVGAKIDNFNNIGYLNSVKSKKLINMIENDTEKIYRMAIRSMLPKTSLGRKMLKKFQVYTDKISDIEMFINYVSESETQENRRFPSAKTRLKR